MFSLLAVDGAHSPAPPLLSHLTIVDDKLVIILSYHLPPLAVVLSNVSISASGLYCIWIIKRPLAPFLLCEEFRWALMVGVIGEVRRRIFSDAVLKGRRSINVIVIIF